MPAINTLANDLVTKVFDNTLVSAVEVAVDATYKKVATGGYTPSTGALARTETDVAVKVIKKSEKSLSADNVNVGSDSLTFMVRPVSGALPQQGLDDELTIDSKVYKVLDIERVTLGSTDLLYRIKTVG